MGLLGIVRMKQPGKWWREVTNGTGEPVSTWLVQDCKRPCNEQTNVNDGYDGSIKIETIWIKPG